jgi:hypothetical protein
MTHILLKHYRTGFMKKTFSDTDVELNCNEPILTSDRDTNSELSISDERVKHSIFHPPFWTPRGKIFQVSDFSLWYGLSLCKSAKFQLSTSSGKHINVNIYCFHYIVLCNSGFRIMFRALETPTITTFA